jgi:hypothetical protein
MIVLVRHERRSNASRGVSFSDFTRILCLAPFDARRYEVQIGIGFCGLYAA